MSRGARSLEKSQGVLLFLDEPVLRTFLQSSGLGYQVDLVAFLDVINVYGAQAAVRRSSTRGGA